MVMQYDVTLSALEELAGSLARDVGDAVRAQRARGVEIAETKSSRTDVVTAADQEAERLLGQGLLHARPHDGLLGEEGASRVGTTGITWVVDPIDGTVNFLYGLPIYAVSVAATVEDPGIGSTADGRRPIAGAVYIPHTEELFSAHSGGGARLNGHTLRVSAEIELGLALIGTGFGYTSERRTEQAEVVRQIIPQVRDIRRMGSAAIDLCMVAAGRLDAYYERGLQPWDYAAGALIAREAGASILALDDDALAGTDMLIAGPPALARQLQSAVSKAYAST